MAAVGTGSWFKCRVQGWGNNVYVRNLKVEPTLMLDFKEIQEIDKYL